MVSISYTASQWMELVLIGAVFGALGQAIRVIAGLKKAADGAAASGSQLSQDFSGGRLGVSLLIGAVAGVLGAISLSVPVGAEKISSTTIIALLGIGYSGADFIEAFMSRYGKAGAMQSGVPPAPLLAAPPAPPPVASQAARPGSGTAGPEATGSDASRTVG